MPTTNHLLRFRLALFVLALGAAALARPGAGAAAQTTNGSPIASTTGPFVSTSRIVAFDGSGSSDPDGDALTYAWDFGDGTTGTGAKLSHEYPRRGLYTITLVVTDSKGAASAPATTTADIHFPPVAVPGGPYAGATGTAVQFDGSGSYDRDGDALTYAWTFGDGSTGTGVRPTRSYATAGTFTVSLVVTDARGGVSPKKSTTATISASAPTAAPVVTATLSASSIAAGGSVTVDGSFTDADTAGPWAYTIVWGDGSADATGSVATVTTPISATHGYPAAGSYTVTLRVRNAAGAEGAAQQPLSVTGTVANTPPTAAPGGPYTKAEGATLTLDGSGSSDPDGDALTYAWDFGDGTTGTGVQPTHVYAQSGSYTVGLTVTDSKGAASSPATTGVTAANVAPTVTATLSASTIAPDGSVTLTGSFTDPAADDGPWTYAINWGDGSAATTGSAASTSTAVSASHAYPTAGSYTVGLRVEDKDGGAGSAQQTLTVAATPSGTSAVVLIAGDIADCTRNVDELTAKVVARHPDATIVTAGDNVYPAGTLDTFNNCYAPSWGPFKSRTWPAIGNHEYEISEISKGQGYAAYFGDRAGPAEKFYYTIRIGEWQVFVINSEISFSATSAQTTWLKGELAKSTARCTMAVWHRPRFYSGTTSTMQSNQKPLWDALYAANADLVIAGHRHHYERFAPQTPDAIADPVRGIRQITVGTGGKDPHGFGTPAPNSEVRETRAFGVLKLTLASGGYSWEFLPAETTSFTDSGAGTCH